MNQLNRIKSKTQSHNQWKYEINHNQEDKSIKSQANNLNILLSNKETEINSLKSYIVELES